MSRISKSILPVMALVLGTTAVSAQEDASVEERMMQMMMEQLESTTRPASGAGANLEAELRNQILALMNEMNSQPQAQAVAPLSIDEIDRLNRSAARERTELEFERTRLERLRVEIDRLMTLYEAVRDINDAEAERAQSERETAMSILARAEELVGRDDEEEESSGGPVPVAEMSPQQRELQNLPRIVSITGAAGRMTAAAAFDPLNIVDLAVGDQVMHGFIVSDIQRNHVLLEGPDTGTVYRLTPRAVEDDVAPPIPPGAMQPVPAVDLGAANVPGFPF